MLGQRRRRWTSINPVLIQRLVFTVDDNPSASAHNEYIQRMRGKVKGHLVNKDYKFTLYNRVCI